MERVLTSRPVVQRGLVQAAVRGETMQVPEAGSPDEVGRAAVEFQLALVRRGFNTSAPDESNSLAKSAKPAPAVAMA